MTRRDVCCAISALAALAAVRPGEGQTTPVASSTTPGVGATPKAGAEAVLSESKGYPFESLAVTRSANGEMRPIVHGVLPTGEAVELH